MRFRALMTLCLLIMMCGMGAATTTCADPQYTTDFMIEACQFTPKGRNLYWSLVPGTFRRYEGEEDGVEVAVEIAVLNALKRIAFRTESGQRMRVQCRVIEEREWEDGELVEVSRNYFARCRRTGAVFYFGEDVDDYEDGEIVGHDGAWIAGRHRAQPGMIMPAVFLLGARYFQEVAPGAAMDRARHDDMGLTVSTPFGEFTDCVKVVETSPLEPDDVSVKIYAPGVGLIRDDSVRLVDRN